MKQKKSRFTVFAGHVRHFLKKNYRDNIPALSGQSAFFVLLSIVPMLLFYLMGQKHILEGVVQGAVKG